MENGITKKSKGFQNQKRKSEKKGRNKMEKQIFIINGSGGVGKDTFVTMVANNCKHKVLNFSSIDKVKEMATLTGWNNGKSELDRKFLSDLKVLCTNYNDMPFNSMKEKVQEFLKSNAIILFLHIREPNEIERAKNEFNAKTILIKRDEIKHITSNIADGSVFNYDYDIILNNSNDLLSLEKKAKDFLKDFRNGKFKNNY